LDATSDGNCHGSSESGKHEEEFSTVGIDFSDTFEVAGESGGVLFCDDIFEDGVRVLNSDFWLFVDFFSFRDEASLEEGVFREFFFFSFVDGALEVGENFILVFCVELDMCPD